jgi:hypothetical protein
MVHVTGSPQRANRSSCVKCNHPHTSRQRPILELGPEDIAFGLRDLGLGCPELGFVCMREIRELRGPLGLPVERDLHFDADKTLSAYAAEAREHGRIVT